MTTETVAAPADPTAPAPGEESIWPRLPVPGRYVALVSFAFVALLVYGAGSEWLPWADSFQSYAGGGGLPDLAGTVATWSWALAPGLTLWRPRVGVLTAAVPGLLIFLDGAATWPLALYASLVLCAAAATWRSRRTAWLVAGLAMVPVATFLAGATTLVVGYGYVVEVSDATVVDLLVLTLGYAVPATLAVGLGTWMRRSYLASERAAGLESRAGEVERESAVVGERARLARDLHDVVAHHVSLIAVRSETAPYTVPDLSPAAATLLSEIADDSRRALDELRGVLGILGRSAEGAERAPQPGAGDIATLVASARRGGDDVAGSGAGLEGVAAAPGYVAYRVVQEALTNARRHAPGAPVLLEAAADGPDGRGIVVRVANDLAEPTYAEGNGLAGMRERVEALGGTLTVTADDGRLVVEARLPGGPA